MADTERDPRPEPIEYDGPPDYRVVGRHGVYPDTNHDEIARFNFLAQMNRHLSTKVMPGVAEAFEARIEPKRKTAYKTRHQVRKDLVKDPMFQWWSAMRRATMETRQQAGRWVTIRQADELNGKVKTLTEGDPRLVLDPEFEQPRSTAAIDHHCMPGSYHTELVPGDVTGPANYDAGIFATTGGMLGRYNDGGGVAVAQWVQKNLPDFKPKRILDIGAGLGHNVLPIAEAFPDAEVIAVDTAEAINGRVLPGISALADEDRVIITGAASGEGDFIGAPGRSGSVSRSCKDRPPRAPRRFRAVRWGVIMPPGIVLTRE